jgi:hypothetical protein
MNFAEMTSAIKADLAAARARRDAYMPREDAARAVFAGGIDPVSPASISVTGCDRQVGPDDSRDDTRDFF